MTDDAFVEDDGFLDVPVFENEAKPMADLPDGVQTQLLTESVQAHQHMINESKANIQSSNSLVRHIAAKKFDQVDAIEASAVEKVLNVKPGP